ncbi:MFS transporter [Cupriavidus sp. WKF15]|uniref:MFS transporter n=1 Tax=Cupriavidus sp. WKF15 TaxID=3032282 RepID=UPI0023E1A688|nr:MFS transporter [Cupriavidus sp. WKF15]WER50780.1 MFS transporter [Cupriavidus sp. WKF15]
MLDQVRVERGTVQDVVARIERMPISRWHLKARFIIGIATLFDAFDNLAIAYVLPVLAPQWQLSTGQIGLLLSASFFGQLVAALFFGWWAERIGRKRALTGSILIYSLLSLACAFAWDFKSLLLLRTLQGFGIGGEVPVAMTYISELSRTHGRGRFVLLYELVFPVGLLAAVLVGAWIVPDIGWRWLFVIGALPALLVFMLRRLPESPRWLASKGRFAEADAALNTIEKAIEKATGKSLPAAQPIPLAIERSASLADLFGPQYLRRTLTSWVIWSTCYFCTYGLLVWLPSIYRNVFHLGVSDALIYSVATQAVGLVGCLVCALSIDMTMRRTAFGVAFFGAAVSFLWIWFVNPTSATTLMIVGSIANFFVAYIAIGVYLYTTEIYPTRSRAIGLSASAFWARVAGFVGPNVIGGTIITWGLGSVFLGLAMAAAFAAVVSWLFVSETRFRMLEEVSP